MPIILPLNIFSVIRTLTSVKKHRKHSTLCGFCIIWIRCQKCSNGWFLSYHFRKKLIHLQFYQGRRHVIYCSFPTFRRMWAAPVILSGRKTSRIHSLSRYCIEMIKTFKSTKFRLPDAIGGKHYRYLTNQEHWTSKPHLWIFSKMKMYGRNINIVFFLLFVIAIFSRGSRNFHKQDNRHAIETNIL